MDHDSVQEALAAYALGAMPADELAAIRSHIMTCDQCMQDADALAETVSWFGISAASAPLPAGFTERVLEQVRSESGATVPAGSARRWTRLLVPVTAVVIAVAAIGALFATRADLDRKDRVLAAMLHGEGFDLRGPSGAVGKIAASSGGTLFAVTGMQPAPDEHDYQLWLLRDGEPTSAGTFDIEEGIAVVETDLQLQTFDAAAVTIERDGGAEEPTGDPVLSSSPR